MVSNIFTSICMAVHVTSFLLLTTGLLLPSLARSGEYRHWQQHGCRGGHSCCPHIATRSSTSPPKLMQMLMDFLGCHCQEGRRAVSLPWKWMRLTWHKLKLFQSPAHSSDRLPAETQCWVGFGAIRSQDGHRRLLNRSSPIGPEGTSLQWKEIISCGGFE